MPQLPVLIGSGLARHTSLSPSPPSSGKLYGNKDHVEERHRHRYEVNPSVVEELERNGMKFVGHSTDGQRMEIMEIPGMLEKPSLSLYTL